MNESTKMNKSTLAIRIVLASLLASTTVIAAPERPKKTAAPVDPAIAAIARSASANHARFETIKHTMKKWGPHTNVVARLARQSTMEKLTEARAEAKALKDMQKAARKFGKNLKKVRKDFEKYRDKAATEDERAFWQSLLDIIPVPNN